MAFLSGRFGLVLAALWLIATGAIAVLSLSFDGMNVIMGVVAIIAGILIIANK